MSSSHKKIVDAIESLPPNDKMLYKCMWIIEKDKCNLTNNSNGIWVPLAGVSDKSINKLKIVLNIEDSEGYESDYESN
jgi:hypothetical protein